MDEKNRINHTGCVVDDDHLIADAYQSFDFKIALPGVVQIENFQQVLDVIGKDGTQRDFWYVIGNTSNDYFTLLFLSRNEDQNAALKQLNKRSGYKYEFVDGKQVRGSCTLIFVLDAFKRVFVYPERLSDSTNGRRPSHSQLGRGRPVLCAGELKFRLSLDEWQLSEINNGSGHYRPLATALSTIENIFLVDFGIKKHPAYRLVNRVAVGVPIGNGYQASYVTA